MWCCDANGCDIELTYALGATTTAYYVCTTCVKDDLAEPLKFCHSCVTRHFIKSGLNRKTSNQSYYEDYFFHANKKFPQPQSNLLNNFQSKIGQAFNTSYLGKAGLLKQDTQLKTKEIGVWAQDERTKTTPHVRHRAQISFWDCTDYNGGKTVSSDNDSYDQG